MIDRRNMLFLRQLTSRIILAIIAGSLLYDAYAVTDGGVDATISAVTVTAATRHPVIAYGIGILCGHFFTQLHGRKWYTTALIEFCAQEPMIPHVTGVIAGCVFWSHGYPVVALLDGVLWGHLFWQLQLSELDA